MNNGALMGGVVGFIGAVAYDKVFNDGKVTDKVTEAVGNGSFSTSIREVVTGGTDVIRETLKETIIEKVPFENPLENIKDNVVEGFENIKEKTSNAVDKVTPDFSGLNYTPIDSSGGGFWNGYKDFKNNGGLIGEASDIVGLGWLGDNLKKGWDGAIDGSQKFYSGVYNIGTIVKGTITGQEYEARKVGDNYINYPVEKPKTSSGYKSSSSSSSSSSRSRSSSSSKKKKSFKEIIVKPKQSNFSPRNANFSSIDGTKKYIAPPKTTKKFVGPIQQKKSSGYKKKKLNYTPIKKKNPFSSYFR